MRATEPRASKTLVKERPGHSGLLSALLKRRLPKKPYIVIEIINDRHFESTQATIFRLLFLYVIFTL